MWVYFLHLWEYGGSHLPFQLQREGVVRSRLPEWESALSVKSGMFGPGDGCLCLASEVEAISGEAQRFFRAISRHLRQLPELGLPQTLGCLQF